MPSNSLFELEQERVIYVGTFSKVLFPSICLGYLIIPRHLVSEMWECKRLADHHSNSIYQLAFMRFIESGDLDRHIRRMKKEYRKRRDLLLEQINVSFGDQVHVYGTAAGMHIVSEFDGVQFSEERVRRLLSAGVYIVPVERHSQIKGNHENQVILEYAGLERNSLLLGLDLIKVDIQHK